MKAVDSLKFLHESIKRYSCYCTANSRRYRYIYESCMDLKKGKKYNTKSRPAIGNYVYLFLFLLFKYNKITGYSYLNLNDKVNVSL